MWEIDTEKRKASGKPSMCGYTALFWMHCSVSQWYAAAMENTENRNRDVKWINVKWDWKNKLLMTINNRENAIQLKTIQTEM